ncbi:helix-turn-helix domain-containing protein [Allonocardiopsis opalescens]|uniref:Helix-turn-helix protein n=1 Tax=Allonocardiopsis opalescens TaxID=1144618 RepID=A0A2T0Q3P4_9ACTN|nr:helix-turn-helix transcriptional regulator [Allonocardiopsis opalescens]PRX98426.1 helix-turn-helix protein [Allonocardiopsis opalescens]
MSEDGTPTIGQNVRAARRFRGVSQAVLAGLIGRSTGWVSMVENGRLHLEKRSDIAAIAEALEVAADDILGEPAPGIQARMRPLNLERLRQILHESSLDDPPDVSTRPVAVLADEVRSLDSALRDARYEAMMGTLPGVLNEVHVSSVTAPEPDRGEALRLLIRTCALTVIMLRHFSQTDLAWISADRGRQAAARLGDPTWKAAAAFTSAHARSSTNKSRALMATPKIADELEPHIGDDVFAHQVYGMLRLSAALACQVDRDHDSAKDHAEEAARLAAPLGDDPDAWELFGRSNVGVWRTSLAVEAEDPGKALEYAAEVDLRSLASNNRRAALAMEKARAFSMLSRAPQAVAELRRAERLSSAQLRNEPLMRELVASLLEQSLTTAVGRELRGIAWRMGVI